jgi:hypothetical protein
MPNYNDNNTRDNSIDQLPRMIFQLPNTDSGTALPSANPVFFCQSGCAIDYHFSNINSCQFNNDGKKFTITPTDSANINYIMWNGTDMNSGEKMVQYTLKEVYFTAPAKDYIGTNSDILSQSIQYYFVFVNEKYSNLMICVSVIGSVNNLGNAPKSNGFVMMETLSTRIPTVDVQSNLGNLNNFNLGTLIPPNKPFFSTLITNNIQYIILTEIVDVPVSFFSNMATMVNGGTQLYTAKMNQFKTNIPQNPPTTILFYNENSQLLDNQNLVCNSNCDLVPAKKITPSIGTYTSSESEKKKEEKKKKTITGDELLPEKCEMEEIWVNKPTKPVLKDPSKPDGIPQKPKISDKSQVVFAITMSFMLLICIGTGYFGALISKNMRLSLPIIILINILLIIPIIVGFMVGSSLYYKDNDNHWISYLVGLILWVVGFGILKYVNKKYSDNYYSSFNTTISPTTTNKQYSSINIPTGFNQPKQSFFGKMFSSSNQDKPTDYTPQITIPTEQNTQPKQSLFSKMFKKNPESTVSVPSAITVPPTTSAQSPTTSASIKVQPTQNTQPKQSFFSKMFKKNPESTVSVPSAITVPPTTSAQSSTTSASITVPPTAIAQPKQSLLSKINPFSKSSAAPVPPKVKISPAELIQTKTKIIDNIQKTSMTQANKNKLIQKISSSTNSNIVQRLNEAYKELNKLKSTP